MKGWGLPISTRLLAALAVVLGVAGLASGVATLFGEGEDMGEIPSPGPSAWLPYRAEADEINRLLGSSPLPGRSERLGGYWVPPAPGTSPEAGSVEGVDIDHNGVRDEVDRLLIERFGHEPIVLLGALRVAEAAQRVVNVGGASALDLAQAADVVEALDRASSCMLRGLGNRILEPEEEPVAVIQWVTAGAKRASAFARVMGAPQAVATVGQWPSDNPCERPSRNQ